MLLLVSALLLAADADGGVLDVESLRDVVIPLRRPGPFFDARGEAVLTIDGPDAPLRLTVRGGPIFRGERTATAAMLCAARDGGCGDDVQEVAAGGRATLRLHAEGLDTAGEYRTSLLIASGTDGTVRRQSVPLRVSLSDDAWLPMLVIFLGVASAYLVSFLNGRFRQKELNTLRLLQLQRTLREWRKKLTGSQPQLDALEQRLVDSLERNEIYALDGAELTQLENDVRAFHPPGTVALAARVAADGIRVVIRHLTLADGVATAVSLVVALVSGIAFIYVGRTFGGLSDYLNAFLWGFGVDSSVRGVAAVIKRTTG